MPPPLSHLFRVASAIVGIALVVVSSFGAEDSHSQLEALADQNRRLQEQVREQQKTIEAIATRLMHVLRVSERHERELLSLHQRLDAAPPSASKPRSVSEATRRQELIRVSDAIVLPSGAGCDGHFPECEFAPTAVEWKNAFLGAELKLRIQSLAWNPAR